MDILKNEILPLFDTVSNVKKEPNVLFQTAMNEHTIYVHLEDVYKRESQTHLIPLGNKKTEYQIPVYYNQVVLSHKGYNNNDLVIQIKTLKHPKYVRVNTHDLFTILPKTQDQLELLDGEILTLESSTDPSSLRCIREVGLPKPDTTRGDLYILSVSEEKEVDLEPWFNLLNYNQNSNVEL